WPPGHRAGRQLEERQKPATQPIARRQPSLELLPVGTGDVGVDVEVVGDFGHEIERPERDAGREKRFDGRLASEATTLRAGGQAYFEAGRHLPGTLLELVQEELVLERQIADAAHRSLIARVGEHQRNLQTHTDRKSTRLNSSHVSISYAVFCLK